LVPVSKIRFGTKRERKRKEKKEKQSSRLVKVFFLFFWQDAIFFEKSTIKTMTHFSFFLLAKKREKVAK